LVTLFVKYDVKKTEIVALLARAGGGAAAGRGLKGVLLPIL
jgi:hypothetical protein